MSRSIESIFATFSTVMTRGLIQQQIGTGEGPAPSAMTVQQTAAIPSMSPRNRRVSK